MFLAIADPMIDPKQPAMGQTSTLSKAWLLFCWSCAGIGAVAAVVMALARLAPETATLVPIAAARKLFVLHANFLSFAWIVGLAAWLWSRRLSGGCRIAGWWGLAVTSSGALLLIALAFSDAPDPVLISYFPMNRHPLAPASLALIGAGSLIVGLASLWSSIASGSARRDYANLLVMPLIVAAFSLAWLSAQTGTLPPHARIDLTAWGVGIVMQFLVAGLLVVFWVDSVRHGPDEAKIVSNRAAFVVVAAAVLPSFAAVPIQITFGIEEVSFRQSLLILKDWFVWPVPVAFAGWMLFRAHRLKFSLVEPPARGLLLMSLVFAALLGGMGVVRVLPESAASAQDHAIFGAVFSAWIASAVVADATMSSRVLRRLAWAFVASLLVLTLMFGVMSITMAGDELGVASVAAVLSVLLGFAGLSGVASLMALSLFVLSGRDSSGAPLRPLSPSRRDVRLPAVIMVLVAVVTIGGLVSLMPQAERSVTSAPGGVAGDARSHAVERIREEAALRFEQGVAMLGARQYDFAITAFHRALQLAPEMPEAHVNMGFALLGKGEFKVAHDFFVTAIELRAGQVNAYYGLALAMEGLGQYAAAAAAMQTYRHLAPVDDPYRQKAEEKLHELQSRRDADRGFAGPGAG